MELNGSTHILVVEDDANDSFLLAHEIKRAQIDDHVTVIPNGKEAWDLLVEAPRLPLAVFLDLRLPGLGGIPLLEKIRLNDRLKDLPVIVMTGSINPHDERECMRLGVTAYLIKPVRLSSFIKTVTHIFPKATISK